MYMYVVALFIYVYVCGCLIKASFPTVCPLPRKEYIGSHFT